MAVLVTGGAGFVGSHLVDHLVADGEHVVILDNLSTGRLANLDAALTSGNATFVYLDVAQPFEALRAQLQAATSETFTRIFHLASPASPEAYGAYPWETLTVNAIGTMSLIELALESGAMFLYSSTSEAYGDPLVHPQPETYFGNVNPVGPRACYDEGKRFGEAAVSVAIRHRGLNGRLVRIFNCYGPRMDIGDGRLVPSLFLAAKNGEPMPIHEPGTQTRSMTYISDLIDGLLAVERATFDDVQVVNLGSETESTVVEVAQEVAAVLGVPYSSVLLPGRPEDPQRRRPILDVARSIGWQPTTSLRAGLTHTAHWLQTTALQYV